MGARHKSREAALVILYQTDLRNEDNPRVIAMDYLETEEAAGVDREFARRLAFGAWGKVAELDEKLAAISKNWEIGRLGYLERAILRLALYEILYEPMTPDVTVIDEAVELAKNYCDPKSASFINGVLDRAMRDKQQG